MWCDQIKSTNNIHRGDEPCCQLSGHFNFKLGVPLFLASQRLLSCWGEPQQDLKLSSFLVS